MFFYETNAERRVRLESSQATLEQEIAEMQSELEIIKQRIEEKEAAREAQYELEIIRRRIEEGEASGEVQ